MKLKFSKAVLQYALDKNIAKDQLISDYKNLIKTPPGVYTYREHVMLKLRGEIMEYYYDHRTELFYKETCKEAFSLIWDALFFEIDRSIDLDAIIDTAGVTLTEDSDAQTFCSFIKAKVHELNREEFMAIIEDSKTEALEEDHSFSRLFLPNLFAKFGIDRSSEEPIFERFSYFYLFQDTFEAYCEENDYSYGDGNSNDDDEDDF